MLSEQHCKMAKEMVFSWMVTPSAVYSCNLSQAWFLLSCVHADSQRLSSLRHLLLRTMGIFTSTRRRFRGSLGQPVWVLHLRVRVQKTANMACVILEPTHQESTVEDMPAKIGRGSLKRFCQAVQR